MQHSCAFGLYADPEAGAGKPCCRQADKGCVRRMPDPHQPCFAATLGDAFNKCRDHIGQQVASDCSGDLNAKGRADADNNLMWIGT